MRILTTPEEYALHSSGQAESTEITEFFVFSVYSVYSVRDL